MSLSSRILKIKSRFYYYSLVFIGLFTVLFFGRCGSNTSKAKVNKDSLVRAVRDSVAKADSIERAQKELAKLDSLKKIDSLRIADSIVQAKKKQKKPKNPYNPVTQPAVDYGILPYEHPVTKYGVPNNKY